MNVLHLPHVAVDAIGSRLAAQLRGFAVKALQIAHRDIGQLELRLDSRVAVALGTDADHVGVVPCRLASRFNVPIEVARVGRHLFVVAGVAPLDRRFLLNPVLTGATKARFIVAEQAAGLIRLQW